LSGTPTGDVILENAATGTPIDTFPLSNGSFNLSTTQLPGGSYSVKLHYGGDGTGSFGPSDSGTIPVTVNKQNSQVSVSWVTFNGTTPVLSQSSQTVAYGSPYILRVDVQNSSGNTCENLSSVAVSFICPTGTIQLFKNTNQALNDFPNAQTANATNTANLNDRGFAEDQPIQLTPGTYAITATYSGDNSYNAQSNSNSLSVTITQASTTTAVNTSLATITSGSNVTVTAIVGSNSNSVQGPTGTVQFQNGSANISAPVTCTAAAGTVNAGASCTATLTTTISALFPPPSDNPRPTLPLLPTLFALLSMVLFALGWRWMPEKRHRTYAYAGFLAFALLVVAIAGCGGGGGGGGGTTSAHTATIKATYSGDANYAASSGSTTINVQ
jgi:hypothetical protein